MPACVDQELLLSALSDGELDAANTALVEAHVLRCDGCREELERLSAVRSMLQGEGVRHSAPESLKAKIHALPEFAVERTDSRRRLPGWLAPGVAGALAASLAKPGDVILVAGKGHETSQLVNGEARPFDDRQKTAEALKTRA